MSEDDLKAELAAFRERLAMLDARVNEAHDKIGQLSTVASQAKKAAMYAANFINRLRHHLGIAINPDDERNPLRGRKR